MSRGDTSLASNDYDSYLAGRVKEGNRSAGRELEQRRVERKSAHNSEGVGYHFGLGDKPIKVEHKEDLRRVLDSKGLMLATDVKKDLKVCSSLLGRRR
jgi:hypothetical protein